MPAMRPRTPPADVLERLTAHCRESGMKVTPQRIAVYRAVAGSCAHPTPDEVFHEVRADMPSLSLATVYKTFDCLVELGLIARVANDGSTHRYDANLEPHHHLVCGSCDSITDFTDAGLSRLRLPRNLDGFAPEKVSVQVIGTCEDCQDDLR